MDMENADLRKIFTDDKTENLKQRICLANLLYGNMGYELQLWPA